jgi:hypothetical protein
MLRCIITILFYLLSVLGFSQSLSVEYETTMNFGVWSGTLEIKGDSTKFSMPAIHEQTSQPVKT